MKRLTLSAALALALFAPACVHAATPIASTHRTVSADARVSIENVRGKVHVIAWDKSEVSVEGSLGDGSKLLVSGDNASTEQKSLTIKVEAPEGGGWFWGNHGPKEDTNLEIHVPRAAELSLDVVSADVAIEGIAGSRKLDVDSVSGDLNIKADAARLSLETVSGDMTLASAARDVHLESVSGDIEAEGVGGRLSLETVSGNLRLNSPALDELKLSTVSGDARLSLGALGNGSITADTMSGSLEFSVPATTRMRLSAETFSGDIKSDFGKVDKEEYGPGRSLHVDADGAAPDVHLESFSGDLSIRKR